MAKLTSLLNDSKFDSQIYDIIQSDIALHLQVH